MNISIVLCTATIAKGLDIWREIVVELQSVEYALEVTDALSVMLNEIRNVRTVDLPN